HRVEHLGAHRARVDGMGQLEDAVGQRRLAVVDVGDDREVADVSLIGHVYLEGISVRTLWPPGEDAQRNGGRGTGRTRHPCLADAACRATSDERRSERGPKT